METSTKPRLLVLGGSGRTGGLLIAEALKRGHTITALVRDPTSLQTDSAVLYETPPRLLIVQGTPLRLEDIEKAMTESEDRPTIIISTLGQTRQSGNPWSATTSPRKIMADSIRNAIEVGKKHGIRRIVIMSMFGAGDSFPNLNIMMRLIMRNSNMIQTLEDQNLVDEIVKGCGLDYVLARPAMLSGEASLPLKELGDRGENAGFMPTVSASSIAGFLLDAATSDRWDGRTPVLSN